MCGRYVLELAGKLDELEFEEESVQLELELPWECYNIAPTTAAPVLDSDLRLGLAVWGLIPHWAKSPPKRPLFNARSETAAEKNSFRYAYKNHRCAVPATAYFEWKRQGKEALPYCIKPREGEHFWFAGLHSRWGEKPISSFCVLTRSSLGTASEELHDRCPVVLEPGLVGGWLDGSLSHPEAELKSALATPYQVSQAVNRASHDEPDNLNPLGV